jgi:hypothetical protein
MPATVEAPSIAADTIRHPITPSVRVNQACRATLAEAIVAEAATEVAAAINDALPLTRTGLLCHCRKGF